MQWVMIELHSINLVWYKRSVNNNFVSIINCGFTRAIPIIDIYILECELPGVYVFCLLHPRLLKPSQSKPEICFTKIMASNQLHESVTLDSFVELHSQELHGVVFF